jgi:hypothetical protein
MFTELDSIVTRFISDTISIHGVVSSRFLSEKFSREYNFNNFSEVPDNYRSKVMLSPEVFESAADRCMCMVLDENNHIHLA